MGIKAAKSKYVVRVDSDDYIHEDLIKLSIFYWNNKYDAVSCDYYLVDSMKYIKRKCIRNHWHAQLLTKTNYPAVGLYDSNLD